MGARVTARNRRETSRIQWGRSRLGSRAVTWAMSIRPVSRWTAFVRNRLGSGVAVELGVVAAVVVLLLVFLIPISGVSIANTAAVYLLRAVDILDLADTGVQVHGGGTRGPVFPLSIAGVYLITGPSVVAAAFVSRIYFLVGVVLVYFLGRLLYGRLIGLFAVLLVVSSFGINFVAAQLEGSIVWPTLVLAYLLLYWLALRRQRRFYFVLSGVMLGMALLTHELAMVFIPVPFLAPFLLQPTEWKRLLAGAGWVLAGVLAAISPWLLFIVVRTGSPEALLGAASPGNFVGHLRLVGYSGYADFGLHVLTDDLFPTLKGYYLVSFQFVSVLAPVMVLSWFYVGGRALLRRRESDAVLFVAVVCCLPIVLVEGATRVRPEQGVILFYLLYLSLAVALVDVLRWPTHGPTAPSRASRRRAGRRSAVVSTGPTGKPITVASGRWLLATVTAGVLLASLGFFQLYADTPRVQISTLDLWREGYGTAKPLSLFRAAPFEAYGRYTVMQREAADWLVENVPREAVVLTDGVTIEPLQFFYPPAHLCECWWGL